MTRVSKDAVAKRAPSAEKSQLQTVCKWPTSFIGGFLKLVVSMIYACKYKKDCLYFWTQYLMFTCVTP